MGIYKSPNIGLVAYDATSDLTRETANAQSIVPTYRYIGFNKATGQHQFYNGSQWKNIGEHSLTLYDDATSIDADIASPSEGMLVVDKELGLKLYRNGFWQTVGGNIAIDLEAELLLDASKGIGIADSAKVSAWIDQSGNALSIDQGTTTLQPEYKTAGIEKPYVYFNSTSFLEIPKSEFANSLTQLTVLTRIALTTDCSTCFIISRYTGGSNKRSFALVYAESNSGWEVWMSSSGNINLDGGGWGKFRGSDILNSGEITLGFTFDNGIVRLFENGEETTYVSSPVWNDVSLYDSTNNITIGGTSSGEYLKGNIFNLAVFNTVLTPEQINCIHNQWSNPQWRHL